MVTIDATKLSVFIGEICGNLLPFSKQWTIGEGKNFWCEDWEIIEVLKYILIGEASYLHWKPPYRCFNNSNFDAKRIIEKGNKKLAMMEQLDKVKNESDILTILNMGRGTEVVLASMVKKWDCYYCINHDPKFTEFVNRYFIISGDPVVFGDPRSVLDKVTNIGTTIVDDEVFYGSYGIEKIKNLMTSGG